MKVIYVSALMSKSKMNYIVNNSMSKPLQSIQRYHRLLCEGLANNDCEVKTISALPISNSISKKKIWHSENEKENNVNYQYIPFINLPILRQLLLFIFSFIYSMKEIISSNDVFFICDVLNTSVSIGAIIACKLFGVKCTGIVTDLPSDMKQSKKISIFLNNFFLSSYNSYIFLTSYMNDKINKKHKPYIIIEGICDENSNEEVEKSDYIMYAGGLYTEYGLKYFIDGFNDAKLSGIKLKIFGSGPLEEELKKTNNPNIIYGGVVTNDEILKYEKEALLLVNPRFSNEEYTKYSFPSKNIEYMSSGTPVLTTKLKGIPEEYFKYTYQIEEENKNGIKNKLIEIFSKSTNKLKKFGEKAKLFVLKNKNKNAQGKKVKLFLSDNKSICKKENSKFFRIYGFFTLFIVIALSRNTLISSDILGFYNSLFLSLIIYIPLVIRYIKYQKYKNNSFILLMLIALMFISIIVKLDFQFYNFTILLYLILSYIYISLYEIKDILKWFCMIIIFLSIYSLIGCYIVYPIMLNKIGMDNISNSILYFSNIAGTPFLNFFFSFPVLLPNYIRNFGIFTEPGFFQYYLILCMCILINFNFFSKKFKIFAMFVIVATIISTFSTAGYICMILLLFPLFVYKFLMLIKQSKKEEQKKIIIYFAFIIILVAILIYLFINHFHFNNLNQMFKMIITKLTTKNDSTTTRLYSMFFTFKMVINSFVIGNRFQNVIDANVVIANTNISFAAIYGAISGLLIVILQFRFCKILTNNKFCLFLIFVVLLLSVNNHLFIGVNSFWIMLLLGIKDD